MRSLGDRNGETAAIELQTFNFSIGDTQPLDISVTPSPLPDEMGRRNSVEKNFRDSMSEMYDTIPLYEDFETQIVNLEEDTQVVDFDAETQLIDDQCCYENLETQIVDDFDTQVVFDSDSEGRDKIEKLHLGDETSDDSDSIGQKEKKINCNGESGGQDAAAALSDELCGSGSIKRGFTSIRAASLRASGLAARAAAQQAYNSETSLLSHRKSQENSTAQTNEQSFTEVLSNWQTDLNKKDVEERKDRTGSSAVRRLFTEENADLTTEVLHLGDDNNEQLSYVDSQEPGDFSQATAIDFVDRYLKANIDEFEKEPCIKRSSGGNPGVVPSAKGPQNLAKKAARVRNQEKGAFDWDDDLEDDRGGDLFSKRKEEFFDGGSKCRSRTEHRKSRVRTSDGNADRNKPSSLPNIKMSRVLSSSKIISDAKVAEENNLARNLDDELIAELTEPLRGQSELMYTVGFDTQLAAEAMEALCQEDMFTRKDSNAAHEGNQNDKDVHLRSCNNIKKHQGQVTEKPKGSVRKKMQETPLNILQSRNNGKITPIARRTRLSKMTKEMHEERCSDQIEIDAAAEEGTIKLKGVPSAARRTRSMAKGDVPANHQSDRSEGVSELFLGLEWSRQLVPKRKRTSSDACSGSLSWKKQTKNSTYKVRSVGCQPSEEPQPIQNLTCEAIAENYEAPKEISNVSNTSVCITPLSCSTPANEASPVCAGNDYFKRSCKKNLSRSYLRKEIKSLTTALGPDTSPSSSVRKRRDMADVRVLYSRHLEGDIVKQQKKILSRLGASVADSIADATHFVTDKFVRTRNMLEAIAFGKLVVTHLWIESCGQANCFLDERNYILRDAKKEKEMGFSMPVSLARACHHPLLQDQRVFITSNTEPNFGVISALVKAVGGQPTERIGRSALKDNNFADDLLILSCEEDYDVCVPFLEKGAAVYSSELLLNGIVTQKLDYERHRLFTDNVKRTRSTVWIRKDGKKFVPVAKNR